jgi:hypothetical protein
MGKLHNIVVYIRRSPQRMDEFLHRQSQASLESARTLLQVISDNATRWNSAYSMLDRAIKLKIYIDLYVSGCPDLQEDILSASDWDFLGLMHDLLEPFQRHTKEMEGHGKDGKRAVLADAIPTLDMLRAHLLTAYEEHHQKSDREASQFLCTSINNGIDHLEKYHALLMKIPVYLAAIVLNPVTKLSYFRTYQTAHQAAKSFKQVRQLWESHYRLDPVLSPADQLHANAVDNATLIDRWYGQATPEDPLAGSASSCSGSPGRPRTRRSQPTGTPTAGSLDELDRWLLEPVEPPGKLPDVIAYWRAKSGAYPQLSIMALDVLSIPPTSCEAERIFSSAKLLINDRRTRLKEDIIEASECLRHWQSEGLVKWDEIFE